MGTTTNLIIRVLCRLAFVFVLVFQLGVADKGGPFSPQEREK
jgi:hypothetical protein